MSPCCVLYNVNEITVEPGLQRVYIKFSHILNEYLKRKYPRYYICLELYQGQEDNTRFYVVASYNNVEGIYEAIVKIGDDISRIYDAVWGSSVTRNSVFSFSTYNRRIPPKYI